MKEIKNMNISDIIKYLEEGYRLLQEEVDLELTDYARYEACASVYSAIQIIKENEVREY